MKKTNKLKDVNIEKNTNKYFIVGGSIFIIIAIAFVVLAISNNTNQYLVKKGVLEHTELLSAYVIKNEKIIDKDQTKVLVPVVSEGAKIAKGNIIATYKDEEYANFEETLQQMDKEILDHMQDLPVVYSSEVDAIEDTIHNLIKESIGETSYNKMQEYKTKINTNISKRANIIGELSPQGAQIRKLIKKRNQYETNAKKSNDNILAPMTGIVSYSTDGLESVLKTSAINKLDYNKIKSAVDKNKDSNNTRIKVINNYEAYIVLKTSLENLEYMETGYDYRLKLIEQDNYELLGMLQKMVKTEDGVEAYFKVTNGIEYIADLREIEVEVVWGYADGLIIPTEALNKYDNKEHYYLSVLRYSDYEVVPVKLKLDNGNYAVVQNYTEEEQEQLGLKSEYEIKLYDRIIIENKK